MATQARRVRFTGWCGTTSMGTASWIRVSLSTALPDGAFQSLVATVRIFDAAGQELTINSGTDADPYPSLEHTFEAHGT